MQVITYLYIINNTEDNNSTKNKKMATYTNKATGEKYILLGVTSLEKAWSLSEFVCKRNNWNLSMFCYDVTVKYEK